MASGGMFQIPSIDDMEQTHTDSAPSILAKTAFKAHLEKKSPPKGQSKPQQTTNTSGTSRQQSSTLAEPVVTNSNVQGVSKTATRELWKAPPQATSTGSAPITTVRSDNGTAVGPQAVTVTKPSSTNSAILVGGSKTTVPIKSANILPMTNSSSTAALPASPQKSGSKSGPIIVSPRQRGNPLLKFIRNVPWEFGEAVPDYVLGQTTCALFLSLRYHSLNPSYIHERLKQLGHSYMLRIVLVQVDVKEPSHSLKELAKMCILADCTLLLAWCAEDAGRYLETCKSFENKPPDLIMEKSEGTYLAKLTDTITSVKKVNKTDASTLLTTFGSFEKIVQASEEDISLCPGMGPQKAKRLYAAFHEPFLKSGKVKRTAAPAVSEMDTETTAVVE